MALFQEKLHQGWRTIPASEQREKAGKSSSYTSHDLAVPVRPDTVGERGRLELVAPVASGSINTPIGEQQKFQLLLTLQMGHLTCYQAW